MQHLLTAIIIAFVLRWIYTAASKQKPAVESGLTRFPASKLCNVIMGFCIVGFSAAAIASAYAPRDKMLWWVPLLFAAFAIFSLFALPPVITIDERGIGSQHWFRKPVSIAWHEIASLEYNLSNKVFTVRSHSGSKVQHSGFHVGGQEFRDEVQRRTKLPLKLKVAGTWRMETTEIPYAGS